MRWPVRGGRGGREGGRGPGTLCLALSLALSPSLSLYLSLTLSLSLSLYVYIKNRCYQKGSIWDQAHARSLSLGGNALFVVLGGRPREAREAPVCRGRLEFRVEG